MAAFEYIVLDNKGKERKGVIEGDTARQVRQLLRDKGLMPLEITESRKKAKDRQRGDKTSAGVSVPRFFQRGISSTELALLTRQLATLIQAALPLDETLCGSRQPDRETAYQEHALRHPLTGTRGTFTGRRAGRLSKSFPRVVPGDGGCR